MIHSFSTSGKIITGAGASDRLAEEVKKIGAKKALFITDAYIQSTGLIDRFSKNLDHMGIQTSTYGKVQPDPTVHNVEEGLKQLLSEQADILIAVGGGSPMDAAKAISISKTNSAPLNHYMGYHKIPNAGVPVIAIPTTAGTGSEVTKVTVITDTENDVKMMILDDHLLPTVALVDFKLTMSMPAPLTAHVGVDTLTHGIEAYVSKKANSMSDPLALSCIGLVAEHLENAWKKPYDKTAREGMSIAACHGGMAFTNSSVCLVHGMSRPLGVRFHLPHGLSNAVLLPVVTRFSVKGAVGRYARVARTMKLAKDQDSLESSALSLIKGLERLNERLKVPRLRNCKGMDKKEFDKVLDRMADDALASGSPQNNPVVPTTDEIVKLYQEAW